jgi:amiloride-sensitive sodium channel subunit alpha
LIFAQLNVYFSTMRTETIYETAEFTLMSLLSSLGGDLSLYIGITLLSFVELAELVVRIGFERVARRQR